jgi:guanylate kinase
MKFDGVILYGPPASGKDTVTAELLELSDAYAYFEKLKVGAGRTAGYRMVSDERLADLRERGLILHEIARYGATYAVDSVTLDKLLDDGRIPIVHMGQVAGVKALRQHKARWLDVLLWCPKEVTAERARRRGSGDVEERLSAWDATLADLGSLAGPQFTMAIRTDALVPSTVAALVHSAIAGR